MTSHAKICGLTTPESLKAAIRTGARYVGFVFFEKSPRNLTAENAQKLAAMVPKSVVKTGVFVDPDDDFLGHILEHISLDLIQLHGSESPERIKAIKTQFNIPVMKAISVSEKSDIDRAKQYESVADMLLFDAKPPPSQNEALPGGNGLQFDWSLISGTDWTISWMLSGGLDPQNVAEAIGISGANIVDVSSGVEDRPGHKSIPKIMAFMKAVTDNKDNK
ncbi:MAG: phosphoribosylanthranilate isomerase [Emcibacter sp.]|nr:phosphoribosylanthranilate isomerase [Emcibacter sp.]